MRKKILHVINSMTDGGAEMLLANSLAPGGLQEHANNVLVYFRGSSGIINNIDKNVQVISLDYNGLLSLPATLSKLRSIIKEQKIDIVHSHLTPAGVYTHLACPANVSHVHTLHTTYSMDNETPRFKRYLEKQSYFKKNNTNLIFLSEFTKTDFLNTVPFKGRAFVLNNFVPDIFFNNGVKDYAISTSLKLVAAGTLKDLKNFEYLLEVFKRLKDEDIFLDIYGNGDKTRYEAIIKEHGLKVRMMGHHDNLAEVLPGYDLFIMPSKFEGFPLSVFEAMASGLPLLLSAIAPLKSIVGEHALYFNLDNPEEVAAIIRSILHKKVDITGMAQEAKLYAGQTVRKHIYINKLLDIYQQLCPAVKATR